jgi:hypothetical protein
LIHRYHHTQTLLFVLFFFASISFLSPASDIPQPEFLLFLYPFHFSLSLNLHLVLDQRSIANILFQVHFIYFSHLFNIVCVFFCFFYLISFQFALLVHWYHSYTVYGKHFSKIFFILSLISRPFIILSLIWKTIGFPNSLKWWETSNLYSEN